MSYLHEVHISENEKYLQCFQVSFQKYYDSITLQELDRENFQLSFTISKVFENINILKIQMILAYSQDFAVVNINKKK